MASAPRMFLYKDTTPKAAASLVGAALLLLWIAGTPKTFLSFVTSRFGRWSAALTVAFVLLTAVTAASSPFGSMAWNGSNWRRWGALEQIATLVCTLLVAALARSSPPCGWPCFE